MALTCTLGRILEAVVRIQLKNWLEKENLLPESMCGFRSGKGTADAILRITDGIKLNLAEKKKVMLICIDGRAAFDLARAEIIVESLRVLGVGDRTRRWFHDYLSDRIQYVQCGGERSEKMASQRRSRARGPFKPRLVQYTHVDIGPMEH